MIRITLQPCRTFVWSNASPSTLPETQPDVIPDAPPVERPAPATFPPPTRETCPTKPGGVPDCP